MNLLGVLDNPLGLVAFTLPVITLIAAVFLQLVIQKRFVVVGVIFGAYLIATFVLFNETFLIWCLAYTVLALIGTFVGDLIRKYAQKKV